MNKRSNSNGGEGAVSLLPVAGPGGYIGATPAGRCAFAGSRARYPRRCEAFRPAGAALRQYAPPVRRGARFALSMPRVFRRKGGYVQLLLTAQGMTIQAPLRKRIERR